MLISAKITGINYTPLLCRKLPEYEFNNIETALNSDTVFTLKINDSNKVAMSWWVSAKRTRSYPYARVYDSLGFSGKKITIIPIYKDEGRDGDRDFLQWDTISLMSLLGVHVIISYYVKAGRSERYKDKITDQEFNVQQIKREFRRLLSYQSDALHWNMEQTEKAGEIGADAVKSYSKISDGLGVKMHAQESALNRVSELLKGRERFMKLSRGLAQKAAEREQVTEQPKEALSGEKALLTIQNYLGGIYFFTADEARITKDTIWLVEGKHSEQNVLPSLEDIKDGLLKMVLFTNLRDVTVKDKKYNSRAVLKLTSKTGPDINKLSTTQLKTLELLKKEAKTNGFDVEHYKV